MQRHITCQKVLMPANRSGVLEEGFLVFADDRLMAVVIHLQNSVTEEFQGLWCLETGDGPCAVMQGIGT